VTAEQTPRLDAHVGVGAEPVVRFLSFGAGTQSSVMLMLAIRGEIERPDHVLWADTGFEPRGVYRHVEWAERQCEKAGVLFHRLKATRDLREDFEAFESGERKYWNSRPPLYTKGGIVNRQCTREVKILIIERAQKALLGVKSSRTLRDGAAVVQIGISTDEARRAAPSVHRWYDREYPLIDPLKMSRMDCQAWWDSEYPNVNLPRSVCTICPYKTPSMWRQMRKTAPDDFTEAVEYDERIRRAYIEKTGQEFWLHSSQRPIIDVAEDTGQIALDLEDGVYCAGGCGI
jgi:hypothetical protein